MNNRNQVKSIIFALLMFLCFTSWGQVMFKSVYNPFQTHIKTRSANAGCVADFNGDLVDDLYIIDKADYVIVVNSTGKNFSLEVVDTFDVANEVWTSVSGDTDNNGVPDLLSSGEYKGISHAQYSNGEWRLLPMSGSVFGQGSNLVDINNDGWLDYFICDDDGHSKIYLNDKTGKLILTPVIDFKKGDTTDGSGNYGSEWVDINNDMRPDLYIAKCRAGVESPTDKRRINRLYINLGNNKFEELADSFGIASGKQSWVGTFGDLDNDGDQDLFVVNHYAPHELYENIDGKFFKLVPTPYLDQNFGLQCLIRDFDNDNLQDIVMVGVEETYFLHNVGGLKFETIEGALGGVEARSMLTGDFNDDGFLDIYAINSEPISVTGFKDDEILLNKGNDNHFIKIALKGIISNASGVGAQLTAYVKEKIFSRYVKAGESYGISNSLQQHFGLGSSVTVDSMIIKWPSGTIDKYYDIIGDNTYYAQEGRCMSVHRNLSNDVIFLAQLPITLPTIGGLSSYQWSNGATSEVISVDRIGSYFLKAVDSVGCIHISKPIIVKLGCFNSPIQKVILQDSVVSTCKGFTIDISAIDAPNYLWSTGESSRTIEVGDLGLYSCTIIDLCGVSYNGTVNVILESSDFVAFGDTIRKGEKATLVSTSSTTEWLESLSNPEVIAIGDSLVTDELDVNTTFFARNIVKINSKPEKIGHVNFAISEPYGSDNTVGDIQFGLQKEILLKTVHVRTDKAGIRRFKILSFGSEVIFEKDIFVPVGDTRVALNAILPPGEFYIMTTDQNVNLVNFGHKGPRFVRTLTGTKYPYEVDNIASIVGGTFGNLYYYYFYDWEIEHSFEFCISDLQEVPVIVLPPDATQDPLLLTKYIQPNPTTGLLKIHSDLDMEISNISVTASDGRVVLSELKSSNNLDLSLLINGIYIIQYNVDSHRYQGRFVVVK